MITFSIIVPIYKGKNFLKYWIEKITRNSQVLQEVRETKIELIFVNDYPADKIEDIKSETDSVKVLVCNLPCNKGIHGARVAGVKCASGDFILMIDQDDKIEDDYLLSQMNKIGEADGVVCNGYKERTMSDCRMKIYNSQRTMLSVCVLDEYIKNGNLIVSPGQVLLRRESIPRFWLEHIMQYNGADDWLLWLLMLSENKRLVVNEECLYTHVIHCYNTSRQMNQMLQSEREVLKIVEEGHIFSQTRIQEFPKLDEGEQGRKFYEIILLYDQWMYLLIRGRRVSEYLECRGIHNVIVYGLGYLGARLYDELKHGTVNLIAGIDRNVVENLECSAPRVTMESVHVEELIQKSDAVIVTVIGGYKEIKERITEKYDIDVLSFEDILNDMVEETL